MSNMWKVLVCAAISVSITAVSQAGIQPDDSPVAAVPTADVARVRAQWNRLAPYLSMHEEIALERLTPESVARAFERIGELASEKFDAHADLQSVGPPLMRYLQGCEARVIPTLRVEWESVDTDNVLGAVAVELLARMWENQVLLAWQSEYDDRLREHYAKMLPLARALGGPRRPGKEVVAFECGESRRDLTVVNRTGKALHNATVSASFRAFGGKASPHFYFIPEWGANESYRMRLSNDWQPVGAGYTMGAIIEVLADEVSTGATDFVLPENAERGPEMFLNQIRPRVKSQPAYAIAQLTRFKKLLDLHSPLRKEADDLQRAARVELNQVVEGIDAQVRKIQADRTKLEKRISSMRTDKQKQSAREQVKKMLAKIKQLKARKADLLRASRET